MSGPTVPADRRVALDVASAAQLLSLSESQIRRLVDKGALARVPHTGDRVIIARTELDRFAAGTPALSVVKAGAA